MKRSFLLLMAVAILGGAGCRSKAESPNIVAAGHVEATFSCAFLALFRHKTGSCLLYTSPSPRD